MTSLQKLRVDTHIARIYPCFINCETDGQERMKCLCTGFAFKYLEESVFIGFVFRLLLYSCYGEREICMQGACLNNLQLISI